MFDFKPLLSEKNYICPMCGNELFEGDTIYKDAYRGELLCSNCLEDYKKEILSEEGEDGRLLK